MSTKLARIALVTALIAAPACAKDVAVHVDAHCGPWLTRANPRLAYGIGNARPPAMVWGAILHPGTKLTFHANGQTTTAVGGDSFNPNGETDWTMDHGGSLFPSHYMDARKVPVHLNELVGAFVDADGGVVGKPFAVGESAEIVIPEGAAAIALGINDDNYSDNNGGIDVQIHIPEANVIVGDGDGH